MGVCELTPYRCSVISKPATRFYDAEDEEPCTWGTPFITWRSKHRSNIESYFSSWRLL